MIVKSIRVKSALSKSGLKELNYSLNPYLGCVFSCPYCYAPNFTPDREASENWGKVVAVKENLLEVLEREVKIYKRGVVGISTITDAYQPIEALRKLTRESLKILLKNGFRVSIQTKSPLVLRDIDVLLEYKDRVDVGFTVTSLNNKLEPNAPPAKGRLRALEELSNEGLETWIFLGPIIQGVNDTEVENIIREISNIKARVIFDSFHYYRGLKFKEGSIHWWVNLKNKILENCKRYSIECHEQSEDWIYEKKRYYKTF
ncbi:radical SAM protein [Saccharolobus solfataricus]|nr:radical SAM protein [Saccharolobus solfataricus]AKA72945.1 radical SAM protein [Saccharolobus solfataricus]AKA75644.1 radical SAM protein [Saccharolobus solfataricus]AKA78337.1 radical SAM protein [Saccharolobus solfataricus]AZF67456.1 radical SAM protein [Saccharolobus solfataricus]AZF70076.1 radical SAM protein [Saccharolobus solfataricus]